MYLKKNPMIIKRYIFALFLIEEGKKLCRQIINTEV
jgi:hypothetical protein